MNERMTEAEQKATLIDQYVNLQRIKVAQDKDEEVSYQIKATRAKLESMGVNVENLDK